MTRRCRACDGIGRIPVPVCGEYVYPVCLVCDGARCVEERIGPEDAIADAETLRATWRIGRARSPIRIGGGAYGPALIAWTLPALPDHVAARRAARAAFRAVPGLRA